GPIGFRGVLTTVDNPAGRDKVVNRLRISLDPAEFIFCDHSGPPYHYRYTVETQADVLATEKLPGFAQEDTAGGPSGDARNYPATIAISGATCFHDLHLDITLAVAIPLKAGALTTVEVGLGDSVFTALCTA